jgi:CHAT domain-containing protein
MNTYEDIVKLEQAALVEQEEHRYHRAINFHNEAITRTQGLDRPRLKAVLFNRLGRAYEADGQVQKAVVAFEIGFQFLGTEGEPSIRFVIESLQSVGKQFIGEREMALSALASPETIQNLAAAENDPLLAVKLLINIGNAYLRQPQEAPALNAYQQALARPEIGQSPGLQAQAMTHIGLIHRRLGDLALADTMLHQALDLQKQHTEPLAQRVTLAALASLYRDQGDLQRAFDTYQQALALYARVDDPRGTARTQIGLAQLLLKQGHLDQADKVFQEALNLAEQVDDEEAQWHAHAGLARTQEQRGQLNEAVASLQQSLALIEERQEELRTDQGKASFLDSILEIFDHLLTLHLKQAQTDPAAYADALQVAEDSRAQALLDMMNHWQRRRLPAAKTIRPSRERTFLERAQQPSPAQMAPHIPDSPVQSAPHVLSDSPAQRAGHSSSPPPIQQMAPSTASEPPDFDLTAQQAIHDPAGTVQHVSRLAPSTRAPSTQSDSAPASDEVSDAAAESGPDSPKLPPLARLVFHALPDQTAVFAITPDGQVHSHVAPLGEQALTEQVSQLRQALAVDDDPRGIRGAAKRVSEATPAPPDYESLLKELYAQLIAPLAELLPTDGTPVVIEPHGPLWLLPFAALLAPEGAWLADQWPLLYAPSAEVLDEIRQEPDYGSPTDLKALIVGNPTMPKVAQAEDSPLLELEPLPGAEQEARAIAQLFPEARRTLLLNEAADRATTETEASQHGILHLATHGVAYADAPLASFIALAEPADGKGLLTARQVTALSLPADLVTLSACQTGLGKVAGDGMIGLSRAFLVAGARAVLVSQWSVSDEATVALMETFYQEYISQDDKALALQRAMQVVRSKPGYEHPRYWAPFVVVGAEA